ncbi:YjbH domain-containing protein [Phaeobacter sp. B1627]|uniref:YjbH domain-containing protein n=1 Tax=Phaeobacter sp. B1627 TaxID=2583809 RepID=UPI001119876A|nr:YjbH domain-containing protein [Phaeobacter sp. B1627]TNJ40957.1 YjbH domain-containing protein [Phaeobacter sp. B1627]
MIFPIPTLSGPNGGPRFYPSAKPVRILMALMLSTGLSALPQALLADESTPRGFAWPETPSLNFYGNPGVIDMPSAETMPDAQFATSVSSFGGITRMNLQVQALPWVSVAFRYTETQDRNLFNFGDFYDRNFDLRFRLWQEGRSRPAVAVGLQDLAGTGIYGGEYIVATKTITPEALPGQFKLSAGLGWGRLGSSGAVATLGNRSGFTPGDTGGELGVDRWFRGDVAPFAGIEWRHGRWGVKAEYSTDAYTQETQQSNVFERKSDFNFGVEYQASRQLRLGAYYLYGSEIGVSAQIQMNPRHPPTTMQVSAPTPVVPRSTWAQDEALWSEAWADSRGARVKARDLLAEALKQEGLILESVTLTGTRAEVRIRNTRYRSVTLAVGRAARAMSRTLPPSVETFRIVPMSGGLGVSAVELRRSDLEALEFSPQAGDALWAVTAVQDAGPVAADALWSEELYPAFATAISPYTSPSYFDPSVPFRLDVGVDLTASYSPAPGWRFAGAIRQRFLGNIADGRASSSRLPQVRTAVREYAQFGTTLNRLYAERRWRPGQNLYARATVGYFENMYGGLSGEVLWKPVNSRLGLGAELNYVRQRDFDQRLGFRDYDVLTGHASAYLELPKNYLMQVDAGRYLAGDIGATVSLTRTFNNGWRLGGFFTLTDVSAEDFGEGSFDKGITLTVPLGWLIGKPTRNAYGLTIRPVQRDGGQRVHVPGRLYGSVRAAHRKSLEEQRARFWE